jgi:hypothetical protein
MDSFSLSRDLERAAVATGVKAETGDSGSPVDL